MEKNNTDQAAPEPLQNLAGFVGTNEQFLNALGVIASRSGTDGVIAAVALELLSRRADLAAPSAPETQGEWLIYKEGRGWYRPNAQGYTCNSAHAGRYSREDALSHSHPNGLNGPRDGVTIHHEREIFTSAEPYAISPETEEVYAAIAKSLGRGGYAVYDDALASPATPSAPAEIEGLVERLKDAAKSKHIAMMWPCVSEAATTLTAQHIEIERLQNLIQKMGAPNHIFREGKIAGYALATDRAEKAESERDAHKTRGDNHWETMRCIYRIATEEDDIQAIIQHIKDAGSGYTERPEETLRRYQTELTDAVREANECGAERETWKTRAEKAEADRDAWKADSMDLAQSMRDHTAVSGSNSSWMINALFAHAKLKGGL